MTEPLFTTKAVKIDTLGDYLRQIREQLNLDIKTVSILTQIKPNYLDQLEAGAYATLPADVYIRGFLKNLAQFYHLKEQLLIDQYEKERGFELRSMVRKPKIRARFTFTPKVLIIGISCLVGLGAVVYISSEIGAEVFINDQPVLTDQNGQFNETLLLSPGLNIVEVSEKNKFGKISKLTRQITSLAQTTVAVVPSAVNLTLQIGPNSAWVYLEADGVVAHRGTMLAGSSKTISAKSDIVLTSADAGSTQVIYNGKDLGKLGRDGEVIRNVQFSSSN